MTEEQAASIEEEYGIAGLAPGITSAFSSMRSFEALGFEEGEGGDMRAEKPRLVTFYSSCGEYEVHIVLANGKILGFNVPRSVIEEAFVT